MSDAGRRDESEGLLDLIEDEDLETRRRVHLLRARNAWELGHAERARTELDAGIALASTGGSEAEIELIVEDARLLAFSLTDPPAAVGCAERAWSLANEHGVARARARYVLGTAHLLAGSEEAVDHLRQALTLAQQAGDADIEFRAGSNLLAAYHRADRGPEIFALLDELISRARELRLLEWERIFRADLLMQKGEGGPLPRVIDEAERLLVEVLDARTRSLVETILCQTLIASGRLDDALRIIDASLETAPRDWMGRGRLLTYQAWALFWGGRAHEAVGAIDEALSLRGDPGTDSFARAVRAWVYSDLGRDPGPPIDPATAQGARSALDTHALKALHDERPLDAAAHFEDAVAESSAPQHRARALWGAGEALRRAGDAKGGLERLRAAEDMAIEHGLDPLLGRIRRSLRLLGERRAARRGTASRGLTAREREVLALVAQGLTNAEIGRRLGLGTPTVARQIASASVKLGASSRTQAALLAREP
jgi:DNA-binding CsgD family transcriptional regulator